MKRKTRAGKDPPSFILREASRASRERNKGHAVPTFALIHPRLLLLERCWRTRGDATSALQCRFVHLAQNAVTIFIVTQRYFARTRHIAWMYFYVEFQRMLGFRLHIDIPSFRIYIRKGKICKVYLVIRTRTTITSGLNLARYELEI